MRILSHIFSYFDRAALPWILCDCLFPLRIGHGVAVPRSFVNWAISNPQISPDLRGGVGYLSDC